MATTKKDETAQATPVAAPKEPKKAETKDKTEANGFTPSPPVKVIGPIPVGEKGTTLRCAIFAREVEVDECGKKEKVTVHSAVLQKTYVSPEGEVKTSQSLRTGELPLAILMLESAHAWCQNGNGNGKQKQ